MYCLHARKSLLSPIPTHRSRTAWKGKTMSLRTLAIRQRQMHVLSWKGYTAPIARVYCSITSYSLSAGVHSDFPAVKDTTPCLSYASVIVCGQSHYYPLLSGEETEAQHVTLLQKPKIKLIHSGARTPSLKLNGIFFPLFYTALAIL